ncbi:MAG: chorismate-binding protein [Fervidicoccaceae archaeon]
MPSHEILPISSAPSPRLLARSLAEEGEELVALLESGPGYHERSRYTIVAWGGEERVVEWGEDLRGELEDLRRSVGDGKIAIGYLSYEAAVSVEEILEEALPRPDWPLAEFFEPEGFAMYDRALGKVRFVGETPRARPLEEDPGFEVVERIGGTRIESFLDWVRGALSDIERGEVLQVVLSRREDYAFRGCPMTLYERLAELNPSPYMYALRFGDRWILGTSPELLVKVEGGEVETHPIAGTRPRGKTPEEDLRLEEELVASAKDRAEHVMLVDLARNDLGKVCRRGTVRVRGLYAVEKYQSVQHLVSRVSGILEAGLTVVDALLATFPAGTVTGAPKVRAMELIASYEREPRGPYAGAVGFLHGGGGEFAITIRSAFVRESSIRIQAGAGIVYDSRPELELAETEHKLESLKRAMGIWASS